MTKTQLLTHELVMQGLVGKLKTTSSMRYATYRFCMSAWLSNLDLL